MRIGYARTSTTDQQAGFEAQVRDLEAVGCEKIYQEQVSSVGARDELAVALDFVRERDTLVVTKLDRLARSTRHLNDIVDRLRKKGSYLQVLDLGIDTAMPTGELVLTIIGGIAQSCPQRGREAADLGQGGVCSLVGACPSYAREG